MKLVVIESPLAAPTEEGRQANRDYAKLCMRDCLARGEAPYASHLLFDQPGILDDTIPSERELGIVAGLEWGFMADLTAVYEDRGISPGMERGIQYAKDHGRPIEYRRIK
jgi:hypothetical protein